jgi:pilus assembly protein Flp/PilA
MLRVRGPSRDRRKSDQESAVNQVDNGAARTLQSEQGATAVEYGMIVALIAAVIIATVTVLGGQVADAFNTVVGHF